MQGLGTCWTYHTKGRKGCGSLTWTSQSGDHPALMPMAPSACHLASCVHQGSDRQRTSKSPWSFNSPWFPGVDRTNQQPPAHTPVCPTASVLHRPGSALSPSSWLLSLSALLGLDSNFSPADLGCFPLTLLHFPQLTFEDS